MGDPFRKVLSGDPLKIPAAAYNAMLDAAIAHQQRSSGSTKLEPLVRQAGVVPTRNATGGPLPRFSIVGIADTIVPPGANLQEFQRQVTLTGEVPLRLSHGTRLAVYLEPVDTDGVALAVAAGVAITRLLVLDVPYACAEPVGSTQALLCVPHGPVQVLWMEPTSNPLRWAIVRLEESDYGAVVQITSNVPSGGFYDGIVQRWENGSWLSLFPCKVLDMNA